MKEVYNKLNFYLNEICKYLEKEYPYLIENIVEFSMLNDTFFQYIRNYPLDNKTIQNNLTFDDVYLLAREIIEHIDKNYLESFDNLIQSGELDFSYENAYEDSMCLSIRKNDQVKQIININREFNYSDVINLVHEFIHYTNGKSESVSKNSLGEFLSLYFEFYAIDYLLKKGINKEEIDYLYRIKHTKSQSSFFLHYEMVLLAYIKFGNLDDNTISLLQQYFSKNFKKELFENECIILYQNLCISEERNQEEISECPEMLGCAVSNEFITYNYGYIFGTFLAIYAHKYSNFNDIVYLNNHINEYDGITIYDICLNIGIDLKDKNFPDKLFTAMSEYLSNKQKDYKKEI